MKFRSKLLCLVLSALMVLTVCGSFAVSAASHTVDDGATYNEESYLNRTVHTLTFNTDDYVVVPFAGYAGGTNTLKNHFEKAPDFGFEPVGAINGDFFGMSNGYLVDYLVTNSEVVVGDTGRHANYGGMTCIMPDGSLETVAASQLRFTTYFNGVEVPGGVGYVNRRPSRSDSSGWSDAIYYFDQYAANDKCPLAGVAVLCEKLDGTVLSIGGTLKAKVLSVEEREKADGINPAKNQFLLYVRSTSALAKQMSALKEGDSVIISVAETVAESVETVSQATSILSNIGYIVKDGENLVPSYAKYDSGSDNSKIGHSTTYRAQWSAFGTKADGTWVFFSTEGASGSSGLTLGELAEYAIGLGCTDVIRLDGGGSTSMYLSDAGDGSAGWAMSTTRNLPDCLMVVKRSSEALQTSEETKSTLTGLMTQAEASDSDAVKAALEYAQSVLDNEKSVSGDYTFAIMRLQEALSGKSELAALLGSAAGITFTDYSEYALDQIRAACSKASAVFAKSNATSDEVSAALAELDKWLKSTGDVTVDGKTYKKLSTTEAFPLKHFNASIQTDDLNAFTPGKSIAQTDANLRWSLTILFRKNALGQYIVEKVFYPSGNEQTVYNQLNFEGNIVPEDCLVFGANDASNELIKNHVKVGKMLVLHGIDLEEQTIGIGAYFTLEDPTGKLGDVNGDDTVNATDYMLVKRAVLHTYKLSDSAKVYADVNGDDAVNATDYMLIKRAVLHTYKLPETLPKKQA